MKVYLSDLSVQELEKVLENNKGLQELIRGRTSHSEGLFVDEQLGYLKDSINDYAISPYQYSYISISKPLDFIYDVRRLERAVPVLSEKDEGFLEKPLEIAHQLWAKGNYSEELELEFKESVIELRDIVLERLISQLEYGESDEAVRNYFFEVFIPYESDGMYVNMNDYILKKDITVSYEKNNPDR